MTILFSNLYPCLIQMELLTDPTDVVFLDMILIEYGIGLIRFLILRYMGQEKLSSKPIKLIKFSYLLIFMLIQRKKEYLLMDVKINLIHIFAVKFHFYFGKMSQILTIINVILWWEQEDKEPLVYLYIVNLISIIAIRYSIHFVVLRNKKYIIHQKII